MFVIHCVLRWTYFPRLPMNGCYLVKFKSTPVLTLSKSNWFWAPASHLLDRRWYWFASQTTARSTYFPFSMFRCCSASSSNWTFTETNGRTTRLRSRHGLSTHPMNAEQNPFLGDFVPVHSSELPKSPLPITSQIQGSAATPHPPPPRGRVTELANENVRVTSGSDQLLPLPWKPNRHPGDKHRATTAGSWIPTVLSEAWEKYSQKMFYTRQIKREEGVLWETGLRWLRPPNIPFSWLFYN